jgi:hypothetical protein
LIEQAERSSAPFASKIGGGPGFGRDSGGYIAECLHPACNDLALHELVTAWHELSADIRETIVRIARAR